MAEEKPHKVIQCKAVLLDIEGTTTSISFVKDILFPYVLVNLEQYLDTHWEEEECSRDVCELREQAAVDVKESDVIQAIPLLTKTNNNEVKRCVIDYVQALVASDRKVTALKNLQGHMWREAYQSGKIKGHIFSDVADVLANWYKQRFKIYIYSSGSVEAQKLLFRYSEAGDLLKYISGHFDTHTGNKRHTSSYDTISEETQIPPEQFLFLTDIPQEATAASNAGMQILILTRPGNAELNSQQLIKFETIKTFHDLTLVLTKKEEYDAVNLDNDQRKKIKKEYQEKNITIPKINI